MIDLRRGVFMMERGLKYFRIIRNDHLW